MKKTLLSAVFALLAVSLFGQLKAFKDDNGKWGLKNEKGKVVMKPKYDWATSSSGDAQLAGIKLNGKWGFVDKKGKLVIPHTYDWVHYANRDEQIVFKGDRAQLVLGKRIVTINSKGEEVAGSSEKFGNGEYSKVTSSMGHFTYDEIIANKYYITEGVVRTATNEIVVPMEYNFLYITDENYPIGAQKEANGKWGFIDLNNKVIAPFQFDQISGFYKPDASFEDRVARVKIDGALHYMDKNGKILRKLTAEEVADLDRKAAELKAELEAVRQANSRPSAPKEGNKITSAFINKQGRVEMKVQGQPNFERTIQKRTAMTVSVRADGMKAVVLYNDGVVEVLSTDRTYGTVTINEPIGSTYYSKIAAVSWSGDQILVKFRDGGTQLFRP